MKKRFFLIIVLEQKATYMVMVGVWKLSFLNDKYKHRIETKMFYTASVTVSSLS